jgi:4-oxalmesaconate hydratase
MIIDCRGHYTTAPEGLWAWRKLQRSNSKSFPSSPIIPDREIRDSLKTSETRKPSTPV